ncbi:MAG: phosphodiester glycosidase family protein [Bacteroidales bacterium]|jgi:hypothetical protein|nr:phosphodiester glycosidase family protein [Bacteroidales bacterium]
MKMLKSVFTGILAVGLFCSDGNVFSQNIAIDGKSYRVDTLLGVHRAGTGVKRFSYNLPEFVNGFGTYGKGLIVNVLEIDLSDPHVRIELCPAHPANLYSKETPGQMFARKTADYAASGRKPVAIVNDDFFLTAGVGEYDYEQGRPRGMEVSNGMLIQTPLDVDLGITFDDQGVPRAGSMSFSGTVDIEGGASFPLTEVNGKAAAGALTLFNNMANSYPTDSAFAWSPHVSTMVSLAGPAGGWKVNERMEFQVTNIETNISTHVPLPAYNSNISDYGGKDFNGEGAILVGNSASVPPYYALTFGNTPQAPNNMTVTDHGSHYALNTTGGDPFAYTAPLSGSIGIPTAVTLTFDYQSSSAINDVQVFYGKPGAAAGVSTDANLQFTATGALDAADENKWTLFTLDLLPAVLNHGWGAPGHTLRLDVGSVAGRQALIRNMRVNITGGVNSEAFLATMTQGNTIGVRMNVSLNGQILQGNRINAGGGDRYILQNCQPSGDNWNEAHPRTAVGYSQNASKVYLVTVDGRQSNVSVGVTTRQLADILRAAGACTAVNLDGGGSTRMEVLGKVANRPTENRPVANALMVVTSAPTDNSRRIVLAPDRLVIPPGTSRKIILNTCDGFGNVIDYLPSSGVAYTVTGGVGSITGDGAFTAAGSSGREGYIVAQYQGMKDSVYVLTRNSEDAGNAFLKEVLLSAGTLVPAFSSVQTSYSIMLDELPETFTITGTAADRFSSVAGNEANVPVTPGKTFTLSVTSENGTRKTYTFTIALSTGTGELQDAAIRIYPNPLGDDGILHVDMDRFCEEAVISIYNAAGTLQQTVRKRGQFITVPLDLPQGMYLVYVTAHRQQTVVHKLIVN